MASEPRVANLVKVFEHDLINGRARWVADLTEFFRNYRIGDTTFELYARGRTRNRGLFISKFFAWSVLPDYNVSLLCVDVRKLGGFNSEKLRHVMDEALNFLNKEELHWIWLVVLLPNDLPTWAVSFIGRYDRKELGIAIASLASGQIVTSSNQVGRSIARHLGLGKLVRLVSRGETY